MRIILLIITTTMLGAAATLAAQTNLVSVEKSLSSARPHVAENSLSPTNQAVASPQKFDAIRNECVKGRRMICGRVIKVLPEGLVVDSGYTKLLQAPFNQSWVISSGAVVCRDKKSLELNEPSSPCIGPVLLMHYPKRPVVKLYDYVAIQAYPVGQHTYTSVPGVEKTVRSFSAGLDTAINLRLEAGEK